MNREIATAELRARGIIPEDCVHSSGYHHDAYLDDFDGDDMDAIPVWKEPLPGPYLDGPARYDGVHTYNQNGIPHYDHGAMMVETHRRDGIEWQMTRVLFSQPYTPVDSLRETIDDVRDRLDLRMTIADDLTWHHPTAHLCVYTCNRPISFRFFRRTFRYWIIKNVIPFVMLPPFHFRENFLPVHMTQPDERFFDFMQCGDRISMEMGLHAETANNVWDTYFPFQEYIEYATFVYLWDAYRASLHVIPLLMVVLFVAKLRARVKDRASYAPGGENYLRLVSEWATMMP